MQANDARWDTEGTSPASDEARDWRRKVERVKRDHARMRALLDAVDGACRALEELGPGSLEQLRQAVWTLSVAIDEHLRTEEAYFAPILRSVDAWGDVRVVNMLAEHNEQRRRIVELVETADSGSMEPNALAVEAAALVVSFRADMEAEERSLDDSGLLPAVVPDQEDG